MLKKLLISGGIGLAAYVINYMRKEYDKNVSGYNNLLDKYNDLAGIRFHDSPAIDEKKRLMLSEERFKEFSLFFSIKIFL